MSWPGSSRRRRAPGRRGHRYPRTFSLRRSVRSRTSSPGRHTWLADFGTPCWPRPRIRRHLAGALPECGPPRLAQQSGSRPGERYRVDGRWPSAPFIWDFPVSFAHDIQVSLDGAPCRSRLRRGAPRGSVDIAEAGDHRLRIRRLRCLGRRKWPRDDQRPVIADAVGSRCRRTRSRWPTRWRGRTPGALWRVEADHSLIGRLGPAEKVEVHWQKATDPAGEHSRGTLEGLILWDITPAGDRVRARL